FAVAREPCKISALRDAGERCGVRRGQPARSAHVDIEAGVARGHLDVERLARRRKHFGNVPGRRDRASEHWREDRAAIDRHDAVALHPRQANRQYLTRPAPGVTYRATSALPLTP